MIHAVIIDDEVNGLRSLELLLEKYVINIKVVASTIDPQRGIELVNNYRPDVVFLDINMPGLNGFELLEKLSFRNFYLVFTTAHSEYGLRAIKQSATDYLLKPIELQDLENAVEKIRNRMQEKQIAPDAFESLRRIYKTSIQRVAAPVKTGVEFLLPDEIAYVEASSNNSIVACTNGTRLPTYKALKEYEHTLCQQGMSFFRVHNSYIVNLNCITRYLKNDGGYVVVQDKKTIPVSQYKREELLRLINLK